MVMGCFPLSFGGLTKKSLTSDFWPSSNSIGLINIPVGGVVSITVNGTVTSIDSLLSENRNLPVVIPSRESIGRSSILQFTVPACDKTST